MERETKTTNEQAEKLLRLFSLHKGEESKAKVLADVRKSITFNGANAWILAGAIIIASVGLNVNSTAVIIGAMLISPLMGPIVGAGFALGTYDFDLFKKSLVNLAIATVISLFFSMIYFLISPIKTMDSEILSRTYPSLYDVIIAFFGGLVGVIAITHIDKGNVIPGVAIATALMPPICVAGYGIATANLLCFLGSFFLYSINCVFICFATYSIVKVLDYPKKEQLDPKRAAKIQRLITFIIVLMIIPSAYMAYNLYEKEKFNQQASDYLNDNFTDATLLNPNYNYNSRTIEVVPFLKKYTQAEIQEKEDRLQFYSSLKDAHLIIKSDTVDLKKNILDELGENLDALSDKDKVIQDLKSQMAANVYDNKEIYKEAKVLYPGIENLAIANHEFTIKDSIINVPVLVYLASNPLNAKEEIQLRNWLKEKLNHDTMLVYYRKY